MSIVHHVALSVTGDNGETLLVFTVPIRPTGHFIPSQCEGLDETAWSSERLVEIITCMGFC